ncbi:MAG: asparagine--tRNA ligase [Candidatus Sericytochromatia bacterium]|nr:asparagine--tRNA ligase [Candidatus Sericytochromatia bacterium]
MKSKYTLLKDIFNDPDSFYDKKVILSGWVKTNRLSKTFGFIELNDGTSFKSIQVVYDDLLTNFVDISKITIGSALEIDGNIVKSEGDKQSFEIKASDIKIIGLSSNENPIQKKRHTFEYLRTIPHLRVRTNTFLAVFRIRSLIAQSIHNFFQNNSFVYVHTPIITSTDAEGAGEMFRVSTMDLNRLPKDKKGDIDYSQELFGKSTFLTVSGQLTVEPFCTAFRNVYTFGPTFRAENSNTSRHASEFWMIEPEMAFADLEQNMDVAEEMLKYIISEILSKGKDEIEFFNKLIDTELLARLQNVLNSEFARITYTEAVDLLLKADVTFEYPVSWGENLQSEHERYLSEEVFKRPVFVTDYPKEIKAFYMKLNDDNKTVRAMDLLVPGIGEIIGGSQREENEETLLAKIRENNISEEEYSWYLDTRRFGTFPHAGFGLGFERAVMYLTGMKNIRDVIPYPRTPNNAVI